MKELCYALFHCDPQSEPPFTLELGFSDRGVFNIDGCAHIPDALEKLESCCTAQGVSIPATVTLIYPIYLEAMDTDGEDAMHQIAWLIKDEADRRGWAFERIGGYTGKTRADFLPEEWSK